MVKELVRFLRIKSFNRKNRNKHIVLDNGCLIKSSHLEGHNKVGAGTILNEVIIGQGSYIGANCRFGSTQIGRFCSIGNYVHTVNGNHPSRDFVSTHPAFYKKQILGYQFNCTEDFDEYSYVDEDNLLCCEIGKYFLEHENYHTAAYWYETALHRPKKDHAGGFVLPDCYDYIPLLQLCVCFDKIGDRKKAKEYNDRAGALKPYSKSYLYNKQYFDSLQIL